MIDQTYCYVFSKIAREEMELTPDGMDESMEINASEYDIIHEGLGTSQPESDEDDELDYALARSIPLPNFGRQPVDIVSTSENLFSTLFHQQTETLTTDSSESHRASHLAEDRITDLENKSCHSHEKPEETVYHKVAEWVLAQRKYFRRVETEDTDDIEVIDPVDLFHDSLLEEYLLLTDSESEKRNLLRELHVHPYNLESLREAARYHEYEFVRTPRPKGAFELSRLTIDTDEADDSEKGEEVMSPFLGLSTVLKEYSILNREGDEVPLELDENQIVLSDVNPHEESSVVEEDDEPASPGIRSPDVTEIDMISSWFSGDAACGDTNADAITLTTVPTDVFEITTMVAGHVSESEDNDSEDVWADAKDIPHWLDYDYEEQLFNQPHKPLYYYRDRIKGCYRIIGVEDETVVLFSENDDDSIFYSCGQNQKDVSPPKPNTKASKSTGILKVKDKRLLRRQLFGRSAEKKYTSTPYESKNDSGIEDMENPSLEETGDIIASLSASEAAKLGRVSFSLRSKSRSKSVSFQIDLQKRTLFEYFLLIAGIFGALLSLLSCVFTMFGDSKALKELVQNFYTHYSSASRHLRNWQSP